jgi:hypothetical protein
MGEETYPGGQTMRRHFVWLLAGILALIVSVVGACYAATSRGLSSSFSARDGVPLQEDARPDPRQSVPLDHWATEADIKRLESVKGRTAAETIRILGHPMSVDRHEGGKEIWDYDWCASCRVWLKNGVVEDVFYTAGW